MDNHQYEAIKIAARVLRLRSGRGGGGAGGGGGGRDKTRIGSGVREEWVGGLCMGMIRADRDNQKRQAQY